MLGKRDGRDATLGLDWYRRMIKYVTQHPPRSTRHSPLAVMSLAILTTETHQFRTRKLPVLEQKVASFPQFCQILKELHENWWKNCSSFILVVTGVAAW